MRYVGIDVGSRTHMVAIVDADCAILLKPVAFAEDAAGYEKLFLLLGSAEDTLIAMEATGHYHRNLFAAVTARGFAVALLNPLRTHRFAEEDLQRGKTDRVDAVMLARFAVQKRPAPESCLDAGTVELRELVRLYERNAQDLGDRVRQLHRLVALCFPEFRQHVLGLDSQRATAILAQYPTAAALRDSSVASVARLRYDGRHRVGQALARALLDAARTSVAQHHGPAYEAGVRALCEDIDRLRGRMRSWASDLEVRVAAHEVASLLTTIGGLGSMAAARIVAAVGNPARFRSASAFAAYVGVVPRDQRSGLHQPSRSPIGRLGHKRLRCALYMTTLGAVRRNPWLRAYYERLRGAGKLPKVALIAAERKLLVAVYAVAKRRQPFVPRVGSQTADG